MYTLCIHYVYIMYTLYIYIYCQARVWLKTGGGGPEGGCTAVLKFKEIGVFLKKPGRDPVGIQSGTNFRIFGTTFGPVGKQPKSPKNMQKHYKNAIFYEFGCFPTLVPDWIPTGSRLDPDWPKAVPKNAKIGARLGPDGILTGSIDWQEPTPAPIFPFPDPPLPLFSFSAHQPCTNTPPPAPKR